MLNVRTPMCHCETPMSHLKYSPSQPLLGSSRNAPPQLTAAHSSSAFLSLNYKVKYDRPGECSPEEDCLR